MKMSKEEEKKEEATNLKIKENPSNRKLLDILCLNTIKGNPYLEELFKNLQKFPDPKTDEEEAEIRDREKEEEDEEDEPKKYKY